jgi:SSS family solute:Na+ symporter/cation/acetate symporter
VAAARLASAGVGVLSIALAVWVQGWNVQFLTALSLAVAASSLLPALVYTLLWKGYTRAGLLWTLYGGLGCAVGLQLSSPVFSGNPQALFPDWHVDWFPLQTVVLVSIPVAFLLGRLGSTGVRRRTPPPRQRAAHGPVERTGPEAFPWDEPTRSARPHGSAVETPRHPN